MTLWYYADSQNRQQGPISADALLDLHRQGLLSGSTLVWSEGLEDWQPLSSQWHRFETNAGDAGIPPLPAAQDARAPASAVADGEVVHAGLWRRFAAATIDGLVTTVLAAILLLPVSLFSGVGLMALLGLEPLTFLPPGLKAIQWLVLLGLPALYYAGLHASRQQASLGKRAVGIKVCRPDGSRIGIGRGLARVAAHLLFITLTCGLGLFISGLMVAFSSRKQALHDMLCDTWVVDRHAFSALSARQRRGLDPVTIVVLVLCGLMLLGLVALAVLTGVALATLVA